MTSFTFPARLLQRLARLALAADSGNSPLNQIALRVTPTACRFSATDGKLLACIVHEVIDLQGEPVDVLLDRVQLVAAFKLLSKAGAGRVSVTIGATEARLTVGQDCALVRLRDGTFPSFEHIWRRTAEQGWLPCASSLDPAYIAVAQAIVGKPSVLFRSAVPAQSDALRIWKTEPDAVLRPSDIAAWLNAPAYFSDGELAILLMPISRADTDQALDLSGFICPQVSAAALAA